VHSLKCFVSFSSENSPSSSTTFSIASEMPATPSALSSSDGLSVGLDILIYSGV
jgi:hypothetical protein